VNRPRLLVSVRDRDEALAALRGGADIIDVKDPARGALGRADDGVRAGVLAAVGGRCPVTAALGDLGEPFIDTPTGLTYVKMGLAHAPRDWKTQLARVQAACTPTPMIAVAYADHARVGAPPPTDVLAWALEHHAAGLLIDTGLKDGRGLFAHLNDDEVQTLCTRAQADGLLVALAGSLRLVDFPRCIDLRPDVIAVRGAACADGVRNQAVSGPAVKALADVIAEHTGAVLLPRPAN